jgi:hypothetical protein
LRDFIDHHACAGGIFSGKKEMHGRLNKPAC